jgi:hypothetical protein
MNKNLKIVGYGFLVWLIPSLITVVLEFFSNVFLIFEIISAAAIAITVITFSYLYLKGINANFIKEGVLVGVIWLIISILLDLLMITVGITQIGLTSYAMYVAPLYIIILAVNIGLGAYMGQNK